MRNDKPHHTPEHTAHLKFIEERREKQRRELLKEHLSKPTAERVKHLIK